MFKKVISITLIAIALMFSGCGDDQGEARLDAQQSLDDGDYSAVIALLEPTDDSTTESEYMMLASAYMLKAGFGFTDLVSLMIEDTNSSDDDAFGNLATSIEELSSSSALNDTQKAIGYYESIVGDACDADSDVNATSSQKDICFFMGLSQTMQATVTLSYLGDVEALFSSEDTFDENGTIIIDDNMEASACAMQYALDSDANLSSFGCVAALDTNVTFAESNNTYTPLVITMDDTNNSYDFLLTGSDPILGTRQTTITNGYCPNDSFSDRNTTMTFDTKGTFLPDTTYYVCPVNEDPEAEELTTTTLIVDALNGGFDSIISVVGGDDDDSEIADSINEFKGEILFADENLSDEATYEVDDSGTITATDGGVTYTTDSEISEQDIVDYLNSLN